MARVILFSLKVMLLLALVYWLAERPGDVSIEWMGYRLDTSVGILVLAVALFAVLVALLYRLWRFLLSAPRDLARTMAAGRRQRGYKALTQGMVAVAAGETAEATRWARRAGALLDEPPLTMLLSAQAAQLTGDAAAAKRYFNDMLQDPETRFLGLRGLLTQALREGDEAAALDYVRQAHALRPRTPWVLTSLFDLSQRAGDLETADQALRSAAQIKAIAQNEAARKRAVLLLERTLAMRDEDPKAAAKLAREAHRLAPDLAPAAALLAELLIAAGQGRRACRVLEDAWRAGPQPELARLYREAWPLEDAIDRLRRLGKLVQSRAEEPESHLALARAALEAKLWGEARRHLNAAAGTGGLEGEPSEGICRLMAELEETEQDDPQAGRAWLARAAAAPPDPAWVCGSCGALAEAWSARCGACGSFDALAWQRPPRVHAGGLETGAAPLAVPAPDRSALPVGTD